MEKQKSLLHYVSVSDSGACFSLILFFSNSVSLRQQTHGHIQWKKESVHTCTLCPDLGDKHNPSDSAARSHSFRCLTQWVSVGPRDRYCCHCSLPLSSSFTSSAASSSSLLASASLLHSHLLSAGDRQQHNWSATVLDTTSCHCGLWRCRNQRRVVSYWQFFSSVWSIILDHYIWKKLEGQDRQRRWKGTF